MTVLPASREGMTGTAARASVRLVPSRLYTDAELLAIMANEEISQEENLNAHSRLFIVREGSGCGSDTTGSDASSDDAVPRGTGAYVYKLFDMGDPRSCSQLANLERILAVAPVDGDERIAWPDELILQDRGGSVRTIGYRMPRIEGRTLVEALSGEPSISEVNALFIDLGRTLSALGPSICVGDLHGYNVIVDSAGRTHLVDPDAFSIVGGRCTSSPLSEASHVPGRLMLSEAEGEDWLSTGGAILASHEQDFGCMLRLYLAFLLEGTDAFSFSDEVLAAYSDHLRHLPTCRALADAMDAWMRDASTADWGSVATVDDEDAVRASFAVFSETDGYERILERMILGGAFEGIG